MAEIKDITPNEIKIIPAKDKVVVADVGTGLGAVIGDLGSRSASTVTDAINTEGNLVNDVINATLDTEAKTILDSFTFGASGAIQIGTYVNGVSGDIKISPNGIVARNSAGTNTIAIDGTTGSVTMVGTITASAGSIGGWVISTAALYYDGASDAVSSGMASADYPFYAGKKYANRATAPFRVTPAGVMYASSGVIEGTLTIGGRLATIIGGAINADGNFINNLINANLDTSAKTILGDFTFGVSGAIKMITDANNGLWISPTGILGKKAGVNTFTIGIDGTATFAGTLSAAAGTLGSITAGTFTGITLAIGTGNAIFKADANGIYLGNATFASAPFSVSMAGALIASSATITGALTAAAGSSIGTGYLSGTIAQANLNLADRGWTQTCVFSVTDADTVAWGAGTFTSADGTAYSIFAGTTDARLTAASLTSPMNARTYIYLDSALSTTVYQCTYTPTTAVGAGKVLIATAQNGTGEATFQVLQGQGGQNIDGANIVVKTITAAEVADATITAAKLVALTITANEIAATTITAAKIAANTITAAQIAAGTITTNEIAANTIVAGDIAANTITANELSTSITYAGAIVIDTAGLIRSGQTAYETGTGWWLGNVTGTPKFSIGSTTSYFKWNGTSVDILGTVVTGTLGAARGELSAGALRFYDAGNILQVRLVPGGFDLFNADASSALITLAPNGCVFIPDIYSDLVPNGAGTYDLGTSADYWGEVNYKTLTDRGCLGSFDGGVELQDGKIVSDIEALKAIQKHPTLETVYGVPRLDYRTMPKAVYKKAEIKGKILDRDKNDEPYLMDKGIKKMAADGAETTALISIMIGAIRELADKIKQLEDEKQK